MHSDYRRTPADIGGHRFFQAMSAIKWSQFQTVTHRRTPADTCFSKVDIKNPRVRNFPEIDVRRRPPSAGTPPHPGEAEPLERVGAILRRLADENPEQWAWLVTGLAGQKDAECDAEPT